jgi:polynucleotide 5'-kinase involved in rRNA processing
VTDVGGGDPREAGKATFTAGLANQFLARRHRVGIVDAAVGQSEIGPPATVGLGVVRAPLTRSGDAETVGFAFIGVTSPGRRPWQVAEATGRLVASARTRVDPDVVVAIRAGDECEHILRGLAARARPRVLRLPAVRVARPRSAAARKRHREVALARYFADARTITVDATRVAVRSLTGEPVALDMLVAGTLAALHGEDVGRPRSVFSKAWIRRAAS